jgi:hypothetical protein
VLLVVTSTTCPGLQLPSERTPRRRSRHRGDPPIRTGDLPQPEDARLGQCSGRLLTRLLARLVYERPADGDGSGCPGVGREVPHLDAIGGHAQRDRRPAEHDRELKPQPPIPRPGTPERRMGKPPRVARVDGPTAGRRRQGGKPGKTGSERSGRTLRTIPGRPAYRRLRAAVRSPVWTCIPQLTVGSPLLSSR